MAHGSPAAKAAARILRGPAHWQAVRFGRAFVRLPAQKAGGGSAGQAACMAMPLRAQNGEEGAAPPGLCSVHAVPPSAERAVFFP